MDRNEREKMITYVTPEEIRMQPVPPYGQDAQGYGRKIATGRMVRLQANPRWYRVYATCFSNAASHWITVKGQKLHVNL